MKLHNTCTSDQAAPSFEHEWQRRAFGIALTLSEFGHYPWSEFQQSLIATIRAWEQAPDTARGEWQYYDHWVGALEAVVAQRRILVAPGVSDDGDHAVTGDHH